MDIRGLSNTKPGPVLLVPHAIYAPNRPRGRIIQRSLYQEAVDLNNQRVMQEKEKYRKRQEMVEHPFGIVKRQWGYDHVLMKGIDKVEAESNLIFLCYNLKRVV